MPVTADLFPGQESPRLRASAVKNLRETHRLVLGLDFGTTNSAIALAQADGTTRLAAFTLDRRPTTTFRSVLYFNPDDTTFGRQPHAAAGPRMSAKRRWPTS